MYVLSWNKVSEVKTIFFGLLHNSGVAPKKGSFSEWRYIFSRSFQDCKRILVDKDVQVPFVTLENTLVKSQLRTYYPRRAGISPIRGNSEEALY